MPALLRMCSSRREDEVGAALDILFTLSFLPENRLQILEEFGPPLRKLMTETQPRQDGKGIWRECRSLQGLDFNLNEQLSNPDGRASANATLTAPSASPGGGRPQSARQLRRRPTSIDPESVPASILQGDHVMISYQHECKATVSRIKEELAKSGIKVWVDYERMSEGSTLGSMADAVESSYAFVMCMSRKYKESNNCRVEAEYAWRLGKRVVPLLMEEKYKPTGWLGIMLGMSLYYDFSGKYPFEAKFSDLQRVLCEARQAAKGVAEPGESQAERAEMARPVGASRPGSGREHHFPSAYQPLPPIADAGAGRAAAVSAAASGGGSGSLTPGLRTWSAEETRQWAEARGFAGGLCRVGGAVTGEELHFLLGCKRSAPEAFYRVLEKYIAFESLRELAVFVNALDEL